MGPDSGAKAAEDLLRRPQLPTAVRAFHDLIALDMIEVFRQRGLRIPEDLSVVGFDGLRAGFMTIPHITTVAQPLGLIGRRVTEVINKLIGYPDGGPIQEVVPVELVLRGSTAALAERAQLAVSSAS